jgi:hypothetical protein
VEIINASRNRDRDPGQKHAVNKQKTEDSKQETADTDTYTRSVDRRQRTEDSNQETTCLHTKSRDEPELCGSPEYALAPTGDAGKFIFCVFVIFFSPFFLLSVVSIFYGSQYRGRVQTAE